MPRFIFSILVLLFFSISISSAQSRTIDFIPGLSPADHFEIDSEILGRKFHIFVRLPENYENTDKKYPTVYVLDGDSLFPILGAYHLFLSYDEPVPEAIIVGIGYGTFDSKKGNLRGVDYSTPPLPQDFRMGFDNGEPEGGAAAFQKFLTSEVLPLIEKKYRSDSSKRILVGQSRGGHFVLYSALTEPAMFWGRIASNLPVYPNRDFLFQDLAQIKKADSNLFISSAEYDRPNLRQDALAFFDHLSMQSDKPWRFKMISLEDETHAAGITNVYREGMKWLFSETPADENE